ncbi:MAG: hypothetical protein ABJP66_00280 [Hyphomicrobiales bacterium]
MKTSYVLSVEIQTAEGPFPLICSGRNAWALFHLIEAGDKGCTPIDTPGPRWSAYVHSLRCDGVDIETITEPHAGPYSGTHARYVLRSDVKVHVQSKGAPAPHG